MRVMELGWLWWLRMRWGRAGGRLTITAAWPLALQGVEAAATQMRKEQTRGREVVIMIVNINRFCDVPLRLAVE